MTHATACHFATMAALRDYRPFSYWPSRKLGLPFPVSLPPAAYVDLTLGGHTS